MRKYKFILIMFFIISAYFLYSQNIDNSMLNEYLENPIKEVKKWESLAIFQLITIIVIGVGGILVAALQIYQNKNNIIRISLVCIGIIISAFTFLKTIPEFAVDYGHLASRGKIEITKINSLKIKMQIVKDENLQMEIFNHIQESVDKIYSLNDFYDKSVGETKNSLLRKTSFSLYAKDEIVSKPLWITNIPKDNDSLYFLGDEIDSSLDTVKEKALKEAILNAKSYIKEVIGTYNNDLSSDISNFLLKKYEIIETYFDLPIKEEGKDTLYSYYILIKIKRDVLVNDIKAYSFIKKKQIQNFTDIQKIIIEGDKK